MSKHGILQTQELLRWRGIPQAHVQQGIPQEVLLMARDFWDDLYPYATGIPFVGTFLTANENRRYWRDYERVTGMKIRYPGRVYAGSGADVREGIRHLHGIPKWFK